jgi:hypothetical protein
MATLFTNGIDLPTEHLVRVARRFGVIQGDEETVPEAIARLEVKILEHLVEDVRDMSWHVPSR